MTISEFETSKTLDGKVAIVSGGGGHICSSLALGFAKAGCNVVVTDIKKEKADLVANLICEKTNVKAISLEVDTKNKKSLFESLDKALSTFGNLDICVNGAGTNSAVPFFDIDLENYYGVLDSQLTSTFLSCQVYGSFFVEQRKGCIVNVSSASASPPLSKAFVYSAAKAGIVSLTQNLAREWAPFGVRVNAIRPGFFPTEWNRKNFITEERKKSILNHTPAGRFGDPSELVGAVNYLCSDSASFTTGIELTVDGGFSCMTI